MDRPTIEVPFAGGPPSERSVRKLAQLDCASGPYRLARRIENLHDDDIRIERAEVLRGGTICP